MKQVQEIKLTMNHGEQQQPHLQERMLIKGIKDLDQRKTKATVRMIDLVLKYQ